MSGGPSALPPILAYTDLRETWGVSLIGVVLSGIVYGVTCIQTLNYYLSERTQNDLPWVKWLVGVLFVLDTLHQAFIMHFQYYYLIEHITDDTATLSTVWSLALSLLVAEAVMFATNCFFVRRIWRMSRNFWITTVMLLLTFASFITSIVYSIRHLSMLSKNIIVTEVILQENGLISYALSVGADIVIMVTLAYYLLRNRTGFERSDKIIMRALSLSIATGALTCIFELSKLIAYLVSPTTLYVLTFHMIAAKLYINALLTALNTREFVSAAGETAPNTTSDYRMPRIVRSGRYTSHIDPEPFVPDADPPPLPPHYTPQPQRNSGDPYGGFRELYPAFQDQYPPPAPTPPLVDQREKALLRFSDGTLRSL